MPGYSNGKDFYCDDCVPRGCSCNVFSLDEFPIDGTSEKNYIFWNKALTEFTHGKTDESAYYEEVDEKGRRFPCCEFSYDEEGYGE